MRFSNGFCALASALLLAACGGNDVAVSINGPGFTVNTYHNGQQRNHNDNGGNIGGGAFVPPGNIGGDSGTTTPGAQWRRLNGFRVTTARVDGDGVMRYFPGSSVCRSCIATVDRDSSYTFNGGNGAFRTRTRGGAALLYRNLSYATFGSFHASGDRYRHFHVLQPTPTAAMPRHGTASYAGNVIYRDNEDGQIRLAVDFGSRAVSGNVRGLSAVGGQALDVQGTIAGNSVSGNVHYNDRTLENPVPYSGGVLDATFAGPNAQHLVGQFSLPAAVNRQNHPETTAVFGANRE
ncbi:transferrin-binding protein-like solute binding protein [Cardiobacterium sp. Marseille-Q4385]|uniref:transferrin-binding protein-like solute binding protein n=1 Tax=Cardiobacterium sp. Marseille-Q4385 TaxID=2866573 RepID=UPI001CE45218|nr:transferrin-binding protein-like solute binding protein [Cardiobacterium sp. Marseille-Q4385]